jgi:hypothetical protein
MSRDNPHPDDVLLYACHCCDLRMPILYGNLTRIVRAVGLCNPQLRGQGLVIDANVIPRDWDLADRDITAQRILWIAKHAVRVAPSLGARQ